MNRLLYLLLLVWLMSPLAATAGPLSPFVDAKNADLTNRFFSTSFTCAVPTDEPQNEGIFTQLIIDCFQTPIRTALLQPITTVPLMVGTKETGGILAWIAKYVADIFVVLATLAIMFTGIAIMTGASNISARVIITLLRIGIIYYILSNITVYAGYILGIFDELLAFVTPPGFTPWTQIDAFIGKLLGFNTYTDCLTVAGSTTCATKLTGHENGIIGFIVGSIFSKNMGVMVAITGAIAVAGLLVFIIQSLYLYISSFVAIAFLLAISPILIPFLLFPYTERLFTQWLSLLLSSILTPVLMFAFLSMLLDNVTPCGASLDTTRFNCIVDDAMAALSSDPTQPADYMKSCLREKQPLFASMLMPTLPSVSQTLACIAGGNTADCLAKLNNDPAIQSYLNQYADKSFNNTTQLTMAVIDCGNQVLTFDFQSADFELGEVVTGLSSGARGTILSVDNDNPGSMVLTNMSGAFIDNETIQSASGIALADLTLKGILYSDEALKKHLANDFIYLIILTLLINSMMGVIPSIAKGLAGGGVQTASMSNLAGEIIGSAKRAFVK